MMSCCLGSEYLLISLHILYKAASISILNVREGNLHLILQ